MYTGLKHLHSFVPYLLLVILGISVIIFLYKRFGGGSFGSGDKKLALFTLILSHVQMTFGLVLYFVSPVVKAAYSSGELMSDATNRFYAVEHIAMMLIAVILITIGYSKAKRSDDHAVKFKNLSLFYTLGLILILSRIPWEVWPSW